MSLSGALIRGFGRFFFFFQVKQKKGFCPQPEKCFAVLCTISAILSYLFELALRCSHGKRDPVYPGVDPCSSVESTGS